MFIISASKKRKLERNVGAVNSASYQSLIQAYMTPLTAQSSQYSNTNEKYIYFIIITRIFT